MIFNINLEFKRPPADVLNTSNQELSFNYVSYAVTQHYKAGLDSQWRRLWARVQRKFDAGIDEKLDVIDLEQGELDFIRTAFKDAKFPADIAKYVILLEDELDKRE